MGSGLGQMMSHFLEEELVMKRETASAHEWGLDVNGRGENAEKTGSNVLRGEIGDTPDIRKRGVKIFRGRGGQ